MKTAISIPDPIFQAAEGLASRLGISRRELYSKAIAEYMDIHKEKNVTKALNEIYAEESSEIDEGLNSLQQRSLQKESW